MHPDRANATATDQSESDTIDVGSGEVDQAARSPPSSLKPVGRISLQLALDMPDLDEALRIADRCFESIDYLEIGTPLLWRAGMTAIESIRNHFPHMTLVADFKAMDWGAEIVKLATDAGADGVVVQGVAPQATLHAVCRTAAARQAIVMVDGLGVPDIGVLGAMMRGLDVSHVILHKGKDEQTIDESMEPMSVPGGNWPNEMPLLAVAGGLEPGNVGRVIATPGVDLIIVGEAIYTSKTPSAVAAKLRELCDTPWQ